MRGFWGVAVLAVAACSLTRSALTPQCVRSAHACVADAEADLEAGRIDVAVAALREACSREAQLCPRLAATARLGLLDAGELGWARALLLHECERGDRSACTEALLLLDLHDAGPREHQAVLEKGCTVGDSSACRALAHGDAGARLIGRAIAIDQIECAEGVAPACRRLDDESLLTVSWSGPALLESRAAWCERVRSAACFARVDRVTARCIEGTPAACVDVATSLRSGATRRADRDLAARLDAWACEMGDVYGCYGAADDLAPDAGTDPDAPVSLHFYRRACALGESWACTSVAMSLANIDPLEAERLHVRAARVAIEGCAAGQWHQCKAATHALYGGHYVEQDFPGATRLAEKWCLGTGRWLACSRVGWALFLGFYGPPEPVRSRPFLQRSCAGGGPRACRAVATLGQAGVELPTIEEAEPDDETSPAELSLEVTGGTICLASDEACLSRETELDVYLLMRTFEVAECLTEKAKPGQVSLLFSRSSDPRVPVWTLDTPEDGSELLRCVAARARSWRPMLKKPLGPRPERYTWSLN